MNEPAPAAKAHQQTVLLAWGFAATLILVALSAILSTAEVSRARGDLMDLFRRSERSTYLIGHIGQQLSRMRLLVRDAAANGLESEANFAAIDAPLRSSIVELGPLLSPKEGRIWHELGPKIERLRARLLEAAALVQQAEMARAGRLSDALLPDESQIMDELALLNRLNRVHTDMTLRAAERHSRLMELAGAGVTALVCVGIVLIWTVMISLIRRQRRQLDEYIGRVELANADLNAFAGRIAHDLRNVLNPLLLAVGMLKRTSGDGARLVATSERIERFTTRAVGLIDALLTFSRAGAKRDNAESCSVNAELAAVLDELKPLAARVGAAVEVLEAAKDVRVTCSAGLLGIVLRNIIGNALKFLDGRPQRRVKIELRRQLGGFCDVSVEDSGPGIPAPALARIFEPFYRVPGTSAPGTGIGLATVQRVIEAHGGEVRVSSQVGEGTTFKVRLPLAPVPEHRDSQLDLARAPL